MRSITRNLGPVWKRNTWNARPYIFIKPLELAHLCVCQRKIEDLRVAPHARRRHRLWDYHYSTLCLLVEEFRVCVKVWLGKGVEVAFKKCLVSFLSFLCRR